MYTISINKPVDLNATGNELILQNGANILRTVMGECALLRDIGIDSTLIDMPLHKVHAKYAKNIKEQFASYEPRLQIVSIEFNYELHTYMPVVEVEIIDG